jgi:ubiquitin carboxyl-terminal hydrolase 9/24
MICKGCPHQYERSEPVLSIGVPVKNKRSIQEGLNAFIQGDMLEGDNAYHCAKCDKKVDTLKRTCVKELPKYLIVSLKRFEFDFERMIRVKVNDYYEFPLELNMFPYTQEGLSKREAAAKRKAEAAERGEEVEEAEEEPMKHPKDYYEFKLKGIVVHTGTADSGHYYSFIREQNTEDGEKWYEFNDNIVRDFDISELANECFGGEDSYLGQGMVQMKTQKWRNAYLVIYERKNQTYVYKEDDESADVKAAAEKEEKEELPEDDDLVKKLRIADPQHPIQQKISLENQKYWQNKFLFGNEYFEFVSEICHYWDTANIIPLNVLNRNNDSHITGFQQRYP